MNYSSHTWGWRWSKFNKPLLRSNPHSMGPKVILSHTGCYAWHAYLNILFTQVYSINSFYEKYDITYVSNSSGMTYRQAPPCTQVIIYLILLDLNVQSIYFHHHSILPTAILSRHKWWLILKKLSIWVNTPSFVSLWVRSILDKVRSESYNLSNRLEYHSKSTFQLYLWSHLPAPPMV